jgi:hypothetical protein
MQILEVLARAQIAQQAPLADLLRRGSAELSWGTTIAVITGQESAALYDNLIYLRRSGFTVSLILVQPGLPSPGLEGRMSQANIPTHRVWDVRDLELWS